jgi:hypothetical protein
MSTFTRTTTPPFSANPFQAFVTEKQARRAAKGASPIALLFAVLLGLSIIPIMGSAQFVYLPGTLKLVVLAICGILIAGLACLGWRIWVRPGPWKIAPILAILLFDGAGEAMRIVLINLVVVGVALNFTIIAFRGALAMKRLQRSVPEVDVF